LSETKVKAEVKAKVKVKAVYDANCRALQTLYLGHSADVADTTEASVSNMLSHSQPLTTKS